MVTKQPTIKEKLDQFLVDLKKISDDFGNDMREQLVKSGADTHEELGRFGDHLVKVAAVVTEAAALCSKQPKAAPQPTNGASLLARWRKAKFFSMAVVAVTAAVAIFFMAGNYLPRLTERPKQIVEQSAPAAVISQPPAELQGSNPEGKGDALKIITQMPVVNEPVAQAAEEQPPVLPDELTDEMPVTEEASSALPPLVMEDGTLHKDLPASGPIPEGPMVLGSVVEPSQDPSGEVQVADAELPDESGYNGAGYLPKKPLNRKGHRRACTSGFAWNPETEACEHGPVMFDELGSPKYNQLHAGCTEGDVKYINKRLPNGMYRKVKLVCKPTPDELL